jgi:translation initiation factor IF-2
MRDPDESLSVSDFAEILQIPVDKLIGQFAAAGIALSGPADLISEDMKHQLLTHLRDANAKSMSVIDVLH